jgi:hypothetical protein
MVSQPLLESLRLVYAPKSPDGFPETNWLPAPQRQKYQLTFRFYGPSKGVVDGTHFPAPLDEGCSPGDVTRPPYTANPSLKATTNKEFFK